MNSKNAPIEPDLADLEPEEESEDEAAPPPIRMRRELPVAEADDKLPALAFQEGQHAGKRDRPEVDELGCPTTELPSEPITEFSWRNFFSCINFPS